MASVIEEALKHAVKPETDLVKMVKEKNHLQSKRRDLLPVESHLRRTLEEREQEIDAEVEKLKGSIDKDSQLPCLDLSVLKWRHTRSLKGLVYPIHPPTLALLPISGPTITFHNSINTYGVEVIDLAYRDVIKELQTRRVERGSLSSCSISFTFQGVIPDRTRELIMEQKQWFQQVFLLVEAPLRAWRYMERKIPLAVRIDPLVLGFRNNNLYLLDRFDVTPIEEYLALEFTHVKQLNA